MINNRRFPRLNLGIEMEYSILEKPVKANKARTRDISIGGISILTDKSLEKDTYLDIKFYLPNEQDPIQTISKVVWAKEIGENSFEIGLEFVKINYVDQVRIGKLIS